MSARFEQKGKRFPAEQVHPPVGVGGRGLEEVEMVKLGETLVDAAPETANGDDVGRGNVRFGAGGTAEVIDGFTEVG